MDVDIKNMYNHEFEISEKSNLETPSSQDILTMHVPRNYKDPFAGSVKKNQENPNKSVIKLLESIEKDGKFNDNKNELKSKM